MPRLIKANSSPRDIVIRYGRTSNGASTMPTKICTAAPPPSGTPTPIVRRNNQLTAWDHALKDAPVEQQRGQRADHQHQWKGPKGEDEIRIRMGFGKWLGAPREVSEHEGGAGIGRLLQGTDAVVEQQ